MQYRKLGHSGLEVSAVSLGTWLTYGDRISVDDSAACIHHALDLGINSFDTAPDYGNGAAEEALGHALRGIPRHSFVLTTKVYWQIGPGPNDWGLSRKHVFEQFEISRQRLGVDYLDVFLCHRYDDTTPLLETCQAMSDLVQQGKIVYWGVSEWSARQILDACLLCQRHGLHVPVCNQVQYSALWRTIERSILPVCETLGIAIVCWSPLAMGILTGKYTSVDNVPSGSRGAGPAFAFFSKDDTWRDMPYFNQPALDAVQKLKPLAEESGCTMAQLALAWCLRHPAVSSVIAGATGTSQIDDNASAATIAVSNEVLERVSDILRSFANIDAPIAPGAVHTAQPSPHFPKFM